MDQCFYLWIYIPAVLVISFKLVFLSRWGQTDVSFVRRWRSNVLFTVGDGDVLLSGQNNDILAVGRSNDTEIVEYPHSAIGHRLSATKVYENNVPFLDWHGLKNFKDFQEFVNVSFFLSKLWTAPEAQDGYINKFISPKKNYLYIQILCLWSSLCMSNTIMTVLWIILFSVQYICFFLSFFLYVALCTQHETGQIFVVKMWKQMMVSAPYHVGQSECSFASSYENIRDSDLTYLMSYLLS